MRSLDVLDHVPVGVFVLTPEFKVSFWNKVLEDWTGIERGDVVGQDVTGALPHLREGRYAGRLRTIFEGGPPAVFSAQLHKHIVPARRRSGEPRLQHTTVTPLRDEDGRVSALFAIQDVTELTKRSRQYRELAAKVQAVNVELEGFAYSVSHDLRAPLRTMEGFSVALLEDYGEAIGEQGRDYLGRIIDGSRRLDSLIRDLLLYSRLSRQEISITNVPLDAVVREVVDRLRSYLNGELGNVETQTGLPHVVANRLTLVQVLTNLLSNATKFMHPDREPQIRVTAERRDEGWVRVWIEDNGIGIAADHQERIFKVFERLHGDDEFPGTGIGLAIVRVGMERLDGRVGVESVEGEGSRFWIELREGTP
ncbi:MAG: PAS domain-containing protein [Deltaproteobacteria bacterium]|nr:PAS domain-containing protein [Deltaproteobacteria bacterium]